MSILVFLGKPYRQEQRLPVDFSQDKILPTTADKMDGFLALHPCNGGNFSPVTPPRSPFCALLSRPTSARAPNPSLLLLQHIVMTTITIACCFYESSSHPQRIILACDLHSLHHHLTSRQKVICFSPACLSDIIFFLFFVAL